MNSTTNNPKCDNCGKQCECSYGHNAIPLLEGGKRVCDKCNALVIKMRILRDEEMIKHIKVQSLTPEEFLQREAKMCAKWEEEQQLQNEQIKKNMIENYTKRIHVEFKTELENEWKRDSKAETLAIELFNKKLKSLTPTRVFEKDEKQYNRICAEVKNELQNEKNKRVEKQEHTITELLCEEEANTKKQIKNDLKKQPVSKKSNLCSCGNKNCEPRPPKERFSPAGIRINTKPLQEMWDRKHGKIPPALQKI